jgi:plastocyanin
MRKTIVPSVMAIALIASGCGLVAQDEAAAVVPDENREIIIDMDEFSFGVDKIEVVAGETVTFVLLNAGDNEHEFMIGRNVQDTEEGYPNGFEHDFFEDIVPSIEPPEAGMLMGAGGSMEGMDMGGGDDSMDGMDMSGDDDEMDMDGDDAGMDMSGDEEGDHGDDADMEGDEADMDMEGGDLSGIDHAGYMVQRQPGQVARLTLEVPMDALGDWDIGCFRGRGAHWDAGMRAILTVVEA